MAGESRWIFTRAQLIDTPSRKCGIDSDKELNYRQQTANFIQDMGQRLQVTQLCINTAIVYMHRFYMFHSFTKFNRNNMAAACLFLAAKVEEQPRKLEHVIKVSHMCLHRETLDPKSDMYLEQAQELVVNENILLQTLGFDIQVDHPHTHVVKTCQLVRASKDLAQTSYFLATNSLHLTSMCLQNKPTVVACVCIHLACKWSNWEIPQSNEGREWFWYTDKDVTLELLEALTQDFLTILDRCPSKLKKKILTWKSGRDGAEGTEPTPLMTSRKSSSTTASSSSASASSSSTSAAPSSSSAARSQSRRSNPSAPAPSSSQPAAAPPVVPAAATDAQPQVKLEPGVRVPSAPAPAEAGTMRRVKTEPALHQKLTPKEYSERRKEREMKEHQQRAQQNSKLPTSQAPPVPPSSMSQDLKERHHMDIFSHASAAGASEQAKPVAHDTQDGASRVEGQRSRERPHGEQHHRSHQAGMADTQHRRPHDAHRHHPGAPPSHKAPPSGHPTQQQSHSERHQQPSGKGNAHEHSNNGHSEPQRHDNVPIKVEVKVEPKENHAPAPHVQPPQPPSSHSEPPPSSSQQKDLKIKINRKSHGVSPSAEINNEKVNPLKMKIKLPVSPSMSRREERSHKSSPLTSGDGLKIKLDLKGHRSHSADDRHSHSKPSGQPGDGQGSEKGEYQLTNQGTNSLKLVISKGKLSGSSSMDSPGNEKSSKRHHSHHRTGEKHHSRKRGAPTSSPQEPPRTVSTSRGHSMAHGNPSKMHRTDSGGDLRHHMNSLPDGHLPPTNGTHTSSPGLPPNPNDQHAAAKLEQIQQTQKQLEQLINLHRRQMEATQGQPLNTNFGMMPQHMAGHGQPPLPPPPPNDGHILPPPPPPPTEPPYLPPYSY